MSHGPTSKVRSASAKYINSSNCGLQRASCHANAFQIPPSRFEFVLPLLANLTSPLATLTDLARGKILLQPPLTLAHEVPIAQTRPAGLLLLRGRGRRDAFQTLPQLLGRALFVLVFAIGSRRVFSREQITTLLFPASK